MNASQLVGIECCDEQRHGYYCEVCGSQLRRVPRRYEMLDYFEAQKNRYAEMSHQDSRHLKTWEKWANWTKLLRQLITMARDRSEPMSEQVKQEIPLIAAELRKVNQQLNFLKEKVENLVAVAGEVESDA